MLKLLMTQNDTQTAPDVVDEMFSNMCKSSGLSDDQGVYPLKEVSLILGVSLSTVRRWSDAGTLRSWLLGPRKRVVAIQEIKRYLKEQFAHVAN